MGQEQVLRAMAKDSGGACPGGDLGAYLGPRHGRLDARAKLVHGRWHTKLVHVGKAAAVVAADLLAGARDLVRVASTRL